MTVPQAALDRARPPRLRSPKSALGDALAEMPLFSHLEEAELDALLRSAAVRAFPKGEALVDPAESGALMILLNGWAALSAEQGDRRAVLALVQAPDALNLACVMAGSCAQTTWRAAGPCTVAFLSGSTFRETVARDPHLAVRVADTLARAYRHMVATAAAQRLQSAPRRLVDYLLALPPVDGDGDVVLLPHAKHLLASLLGMTPENLSRAIASLAPHGVAIHGSRVAIQDRQRLRATLEPGAAPEA